MEEVSETPCIIYYSSVLSQGKRLNTFKELKQSIQTLWREIETVPSTSIEKELAKSDAETTFKLSSDNMEHLRGLNTEVRCSTPLMEKKEKQIWKDLIIFINLLCAQLENQQKRLIAESSELTETIKSLWSKLEVDESDRKVFLAKHVGSKPSVITKVSSLKFWLSDRVSWGKTRKQIMWLLHIMHMD